MGVPLLDITAPRSQWVPQVGRALEDFGFVAIQGHGVPSALLDRAYRVAERVFALPVEAKRACETPADGRQRGYTSFGVEHAKDQSAPDLKEFWHVGRPPAESPLDLPPNRFPEEVPELAEVGGELFAALDRFSRELLVAVAEHLELPAEHFVERVEGGNSLLRLIHYPPLSHLAGSAGAVRAAAHEDVNLLTVLPASTAPGLEIRGRDGQWLPVEPPPGAMICDSGDMMALMTGGRLPATTHRVVNPQGALAEVSRYSLPFFVHPRPDVHLTPGGPTAEAFLQRRLEEIGLR